MKKSAVYDVETYEECFLAHFMSMSTNQHVVFEISQRKNELEELRAFISANRHHRFIGFNNLAFDYPIIHYLLHLPRGMHWHYYTKQIYIKAGQLISEEKPFFNIVRDELFENCDIYKIFHFDSFARATSLKKLEFQMKLSSVKDLPYAPNARLTIPMIETLVQYVKHDVIATATFVADNIDRITFRDELTEQYGHKFLNYSDSKLGETIMRLEYEKATGTNIYKMRTHRDEIRIRDIIFPYVRFRSPEFKNMLRYFQDMVISETKGAFTGMEFDVMDAYFGPDGYKHKKKKGLQENLNVIFDGLYYVFGTGGIHASDKGEFQSNEDYVLVDVDVASYYPNLAIQNKIYPAHLGEAFCTVYNNLYLERKKHAKGTMLNKSIKLALNSTYGKSNSKYSCFYDPQFTMAITINGQLLLAKLAEMIIYNVPDSKIIQANTDGLTTYIPRAQYERLKHVCSVWEQNTKLVLEFNDYKSMYIGDVNNYIAIYADGGKVKRKGKFEYDVDEHQNHSNKASRKAAEAYLINKTPLDVYLRQLAETNKYDFFLLTNVNRKSKVIQEYEDRTVEHQRNSRYYVSTPREKAKQIVKIMPPLAKQVAKGITDPRRININDGYESVILNDEYITHNFTFDFEFYEDEANKLIKRIYA